MKYMNLLGRTMVSVAVLAAFGGANAAQNGRNNMANNNPGRMPTMPTVSLNTIGNPAVNTVSSPTGTSNGIPTPTPIPTPIPTPTSCPDGGVENSDYTVAMCMDDLLQCINTGALQGGINDLFNADVRNSIMSGMMVCQSAVDKCIKEVRVNCHNIYKATTDVWLDFNSRVIQPEYYNFVMRKTGLTPNQAENTCLLLDRNTYGTSFAAVSDSNAVNTEYNQRVGAYNEAMNGTLSKNNPQGVSINTTGYDGNRGHYARWDASKAECLIRVAAYNKDNLITNSWLFGAIGDDTPAEVWQKAGGTFTCNKELFDFKSLLNDTKTTAVIAVPGGTLLGAGIGAAAGAGAYNKKNEEKYADRCLDEEYRRNLGYQIRSSNKDWVLDTYLYETTVDVNNSNSDDNKSEKDAGISFTGKKLFDNGIDYANMTEKQCQAIHDLYSKLELYREAVNDCNIYVERLEKTEQITVPNVVEYERVYCETESGTTGYVERQITCGEKTTSKTVIDYKNKCLFKPLQVGLAVDTSKTNPLCNPGKTCVSVEYIQREMAKLQSLLDEIKPAVDKNALAKLKKLDKGAEIGKGVAIGAVTGAGVGGIVTGITALVEKNNITCRVGDGLNTISLGKSHTIDSLKDFYVKWNLKLPDTVAPTAVVVDVASWQQACAQFNSRLMDCPYVQVNLQTPGQPAYQLINAACVQSGSVCIPNTAVVNSNLP